MFELTATVDADAEAHVHVGSSALLFSNPRGKSSAIYRDALARIAP